MNKILMAMNFTCLVSSQQSQHVGDSNNPITIAIAILTSTVIATAISSIISYIINKKNVQLQYITTERSKWRSDLRKKSKRIISVLYSDINDDEKKRELISIKHQLALKMNPEDDYDMLILDEVERLEEHPNQGEEKQLVHLLSYLLKHDWERAKKEARLSNNYSYYDKKLRKISQP